MKTAPRPAGASYRRAGRLAALVAVLVVAVTTLLLQQYWFSDAARQRRLGGRTMSQLEKEAPGSRDPLVHYYLARRRLEVGDSMGAIAALETVLSLDPHFTPARATLGTVLMSDDRDQEAFLQLRQAIQDDPGSLDAYMGLALFYQRQEAWHRQAEAASAATQVRPEHAPAWILLGQAKLRQQAYGEAADAFARAASLAPHNGEAAALGAFARMALGRLDLAETQARAAVAAQPKQPLGYAVLGEVMLRLNRMPEAREAFEKALALGDATGRASLGLARTLQKQQQYVEAEQQFRFALRADPANNEARYGLMQVLRAQDKDEEAAAVEREFKEWTRYAAQRVRLNDRIAQSSQDPRAWFELAALYSRMRLWPQARRAALSGLRRAPADPQGQKLLAEIDRHAP